MSINIDVRHALMAATATVCIGTATPAIAQLRDFNVPAQEAARGVAALARQADAQILISGRDARGKQTRAIKGSMTIEQALERLLRDSGLVARRTAASAWSVVPEQPGPRTFAQAPVPASLGRILESDSDAEAVIVVTAQKREETLIEIPLSISVVGGAELERRNATSLKDLPALIPGLSVNSSGTPGVARIILRGINTGGPNATVGVYVDETPFGSSTSLVSGGVTAGDFDTFDVARVEVLRGPQGTLYGASSLGGVLKYVTNKPSLTGVEARGRAGIESTKGGDLGYSGTAMINMPLDDTLAIRASGFYRHTGGFIDLIGTAGSRVQDNYNSSEIYGGRVSALFEPSDSLSVRVSAIMQNLDSSGSSAIEVEPETLVPLYGRLSISEFVPTFSNIRYRLYNMTASQSLGFADLVSSTSYGTFDMKSHANVVLPFRALVTQLFGDPVTRPLDIFPSVANRQHKFTQELRLASPANDRFEWLAGIYYTRETAGLRQAYNAFDILANKPATDVPSPIRVSIDSVYKEYAVFANLTWHISDRFDLSFGGRFSRNEQRARQAAEGVLNGGPSEYPDGVSSDNVFTYSIAPHYKLSDNAALYARIATGYRPGGPNILPLTQSTGVPRNFASDSLVSHEIGLKADLPDHTFSIDVSAFYLRWKDIQLITVVDTYAINDNGKTATSKGAEFTGTFRPTKGLTVSINGAYTNARLTADTSAFLGGLDGDRLPVTPEWAFNTHANYEWAFSGSATAFVGGGLRFVGKQPVNFDKEYRATHARPRMLPSYEVIDITAGIDFGGWTIEAFVRNLGNSDGLTAVSSEGERAGIVNGAALSSIIQPRSIGLTFGAQF